MARKAHWGRPLGGKRVHEHLLVIMTCCYGTRGYHALAGREWNCIEGLVGVSIAQEYCT